MCFWPRHARSASAVLLSYVVRPSVTLLYAGHIGWTSSKLITRITRKRCTGQVLPSAKYRPKATWPMKLHYHGTTDTDYSLLQQKLAKTLPS